MEPPSIYDHVSPTDSDYPDGIYRVVGTSEDSMTLLRVGNIDGQRVNTGEIHTVSYNEFNSFDPAPNPDGNRSLTDTVRSSLQMPYWSIRVFLQQLAAHPPMTVAVLLVIAVGFFGEGVVQLPDIIFQVLTIVGSLGLAYIGSGRL